MDRQVVRAFRRAGRDLFISGLVTSHGGNMSIRLDDRIVITRRGAMLGRLEERDLVETGMRPSEVDGECSREIVVHRAIYARTDARALIHAHPPYTIAHSFTHGSVEPVDSEGLYVLGEVPVVRAVMTIASPEAASVLAEAMREAPAAVLRTHGPFAKGATLEEALMRISVLEASARILHLLEV